MKTKEELIQESLEFAAKAKSEALQREISEVEKIIIESKDKMKFAPLYQETIDHFLSIGVDVSSHKAAIGAYFKFDVNGTGKFTDHITTYYEQRGNNELNEKNSKSFLQKLL